MKRTVLNMKDAEVEARVLERMKDGRERTLEDISHHVPAPMDQLRATLRRLARKRKLESTALSTKASDWTPIYKMRVKEGAA